MNEGSDAIAETATGEVSLAEVNALRRAGAISRAQFVDAAYICRDSHSWRLWSMRALLALGTGHLLAGIIFFFAFNWEKLPLLGKFAILESGVVVAVIAAFLARLERPAGQAFLIGATVLAGVLLAVIGQVYQTGADAWQLFTTWALVTLPWVIASRSAAHWLVWLLIAFLAANLYGIQVLIVSEVISYAQLNSLAAIAAALVLAVREILVSAGTEWLRPRWTRLLLVVGAPLIVFMPAIGYVFRADDNLVSAATFILLLLALTGAYLRPLHDFAAVSISTGFASLFLMAVGGRVISETISFNWDNAWQLIFAMTLLTLWCAGMTTGTVKLLTRLRQQMGNGDSCG